MVTFKKYYILFYSGLFMAVRLYEDSHPFLGTLVLLMGIAFSLGATMDFLLLTKVKNDTF